MKIEWDFSEITAFTSKFTTMVDFDKYVQQITRELANALRESLFKNTPVDTGNLAANWGGAENYSFEVKQTATGYMVTLYNRAANNKSPKYPNFQYGLAVNDGHKTPGGGGWVVGKFFVEKSIIQLANSTQLESIIMKELQKWWDSI